MIKTPPCGLKPSGDRPNFVLFVSFVVNIFFLTWLRLRRASPSWLKHLHIKPGRTYDLNNSAIDGIMI
jgi:hypothetical protein